MSGKDIATNVREGKDTVINLGGKEYVFEPAAFLLDAVSPEGYSAVEERGYLAALNTQLTPELVREGLARDVIRLVQNARKNAGLEVSDFIRVGLETSDNLKDAVEAHRDTIAKEVLARELTTTHLADAYEESLEVEGTPLTVTLKKLAVAETV